MLTLTEFWHIFCLEFEMSPSKKIVSLEKMHNFYIGRFFSSYVKSNGMIEVLKIGLEF
jgi:hypothetical protein